ncbi:MAG: endonuclease/exonuclease/phosphatase family protein [Verrucomicrobiae bacterium]|nr:endonuclease/exonuclease/phosphatase family protein [Verrucomicrobiae bacterium]
MVTLWQQFLHWCLGCWAAFCLVFSPSVAQVPQPPLASANAVVVASYNVENYLMMPRWVDGHYRSNAGKPVAEKEAVTKMLTLVHPDILGLMEMGDQRQFNDLERRLQEAGMTFSDTEYLQGPDQQRHVALLSRFPIVERHSEGFIPIQVQGKKFYSSRGFLDVTIALPSNLKLRVLCVHLKSKIPVREYSQFTFRAAEAAALKAKIETILTSDPTTPLLVMGDFNDTKNSLPIKTILVNPGAPGILTALELHDDRGETWTEYWKGADEYSRIDYIMVNDVLKKRIDTGHSAIERPAFWNEASDHCPVFTTLSQ